MIIPSIDLQGGQAVQLVGGRERAVDAGDPERWARRFGAAGPIAVIDLDAALGTGHHRAIIMSLVERYRCVVGGGIRTVEQARAWLDAGAEKVILGTAARPELLAQLPRDRVVAALDAVDDEVVVDGWTTRTGATVAERMRELLPFVASFLVTFVEREGRMAGTRLDEAQRLKALAGDARLTVAGGVTTEDDVRALDAIGVDAQVGMALYTGRLSLGRAVFACLRSDRPDGLVPTIVESARGEALGLTYSSAESLARALDTGRGVYWSRRRGLWEKGATSGATQRLVRVDLDCDRDALRFVVEQDGDGFCHLGSPSCFGDFRGLRRLDATLAARRRSAPPGSYSGRLFGDADLLRAKLLEEAAELAAAEGRAEVLHEAADVLYFTLAKLAANGLALGDVEAELDRRARGVTRRAGDAKPSFAAQARGLVRGEVRS
jgi:phosphoribosyl-ATP pyrophosphohydrolase/phosphoribosyl-AMP cyclohydrolase